ncbi:MAG TPA: hypothetical protein VFY99_06505 [Solirubrobacterales bacterium]
MAEMRAIVVGVLAAVLALFALASDAGAEEILGWNEDAVGGEHGVSPDQYAGLVRVAGGNAIRTNLDWRVAEPGLDAWDESWWSKWDALYDAALERGVRPIFVVGFAPRWAREPGVGCDGPVTLPLIHAAVGPCEMPPRPAMDLEWAEYAAEVARRFPRATIEVWNEPNTDDFWRPAPDPKRYAELLTLAYHAIKATSPGTEVVSGGLLNVRRTDPLKGEVSVRDFLSVAYASLPSIEGSADYIGLHPYPVGSSVGPGSRFRRAFGDLRAIRDAHGDRTPILVTETGVSTADLVLARERRQANAIERIQAQVESMPDVAGVVYHRVIEPLDSTVNPREHGYAWLRFGGSPLRPRPVFCRFAAAAGHAYPGC